MSNVQTLKHFTSDQSREEAVKNGRKGGLASGKAKQQKKAWKEIADVLGDMKLTNTKQLNNVKGFFGELNGDINHDVAVIASAYVQAYQGNVQAMRFLAELKEEITEKKNIKIESDQPIFNIIQKTND